MLEVVPELELRSLSHRAQDIIESNTPEHQHGTKVGQEINLSMQERPALVLLPQRWAIARRRAPHNGCFKSIMKKQAISAVLRHRLRRESGTKQGFRQEICSGDHP